MRRAAALVVAALALGAAPAVPAQAAPPAATAAVAAVTLEDAEGVLPPDQAALLRRRLAGLATRGVAVVYVRRAPAGGAEALAESAFARLALPDDGLVVAVAVDDREVAAHVGATIRARHVDRAVIKDLIGLWFKASARKGRYDLAAGALAEAIVAARPGLPTPPPTPAPEPSFWSTDAGWAVMALGALGLVAAVGIGLAVAGTSTPGGVPPARRAKPATGRPREVELAELHAARERVRSDAGALQGLAAPPGLADTIAALLAEARAFEAACAAVPELQDAADDGGSAGGAAATLPAADRRASGGVPAPAAVDLGVLTMTALNLEVAIAALRTAVAAGAPARANEALLAGRRWKHAEVQAEYLIREGHAADGNAAFLEEALADAWAALRGVPQDLARADRKLDQAEMRLKGLGLTRLAAAPAAGGAVGGGWLSATAASASAAREHEAMAGSWDLAAVVVEAFEPPPARPEYVAPPSSGSSSGSSSWSGSSSGSSSWSSSDSGSSSWSSSDSGSSSWSSSDSGSSSWGSDSTGSDKW